MLLTTVVWHFALVFFFILVFHFLFAVLSFTQNLLLNKHFMGRGNVSLIICTFLFLLYLARLFFMNARVIFI